jgi:dTMP kinase
LSVPCWITVEGVNGVGKTHLMQRVADRLGPDCVLVAELTDHQPDRLPGRIITAMASAGGTFLRTGHPRTETLALIALKVREYEHRQRILAPQTRLVLEDRGIDTVAVYQAAILAGSDASLLDALEVAQRIYRTALAWRPLPQRTLLLIDDLDACLRRFVARTGEPVSRPDEALIAQVHELYLAQAAAEPQRFVVIDRAGHAETKVVDDLEDQCRSLLEARCTR